PTRHAFKSDIDRLIESGFLLKEGKSGISVSYKIIQTPLNYVLSNNDKQILKEIFETYSNNNIGLQRFFEQIGQILNFKIKDLIYIQDVSKYKNKDIYLDVKSKLQEAINNYSGQIKEISFEYLPIGKHQTSIWSVFPYKIEIDNKKTERVYVYSKNLKVPKYFNLGRIMSIPIIKEQLISKEEILKNYETVQFRLYPPVSKSYHLCAGETKIIENEEKETVIIETPFLTSFDLCQKVLKYGQYAEIIDHQESIEKMKQIIDDMKKMYG
ncbi:MAG: WYL domain-containing protein, partial [Candidatus Sericytochromatia bacterium]|nr:WYL domain-containing protein [Candidatus Sericytochromatia bacterium]